MEKEVIKKPSKKWAYAIGLVVVLATGFLSRDVFLPHSPGDIDIAIVIAVEWSVFLALLTFWIPRIEGTSLGTIGFGKFRLRHLWMSILTYFMLMVVWIGSGLGLNTIGLESLRSLQPTIAELGLLIRFSLLLTGTFLEEIFYRGYIIEKVTALTGRS